jgi:homoserine O-acetyltransferase/O-succinyltransferase
MPALSDVPNYAALIHGQNIHIVDSFALESDVVLHQVPVAYKTWGVLNEKRDNVMVICHAFTGSSDVEDWYDTPLRSQRSCD